MYKYITTIIALIILTINASAQHSQPDFNNWVEESKSNFRLLPRYGHINKTRQQLEADSVFVAEILALPDFKSRRQESDGLVQKGFQYLYRGDVKTAMYRFNQAYLIDSTNSNDYWGYGAVYMYFGKYDLAAEQYKTGLAKDPDNAYILTDYATLYMGKFYNGDETAVDTALQYLIRSYDINNSYGSTLFKLSICYWMKEDCEKAKLYLQKCEAIQPELITNAYRADLKKVCD